MAGTFLCRVIPKQQSDRVAFLFLILMTHIVGLFELLIILPYIDYERNKTFWIHVVCGLSIYVNVYASFYLLCVTDSTVRDRVLPSTLRTGWFYCSPCGVNAPPRSFHCHLCETCVLRRDHHCMFSGNCVGHSNQRYFFTMLFYLTLGAAYCNYLNMDYTLEVLGGVSLKSLITMILPLLSWTVGFAGAETFAVSFISSLCLVGLGLFLVMFVYHVRNMLGAQTCNERTRGVRDYDCGWKSNLETVMGDRWYVAWISPFISSPQSGDGLEFRRKYKYEDIKNM